MQTIKRSLRFFGLSVLLILPACQSFVEAGAPRHELLSNKVFQSDASATAAILHIYGSLNSQSNYASGWISGISCFGGYLADDFLYYGTSDGGRQMYTNNMLNTNGTAASLWSFNYKLIYNVNAALEGLTASTSVTPATKSQLMGEALFIRAFAHFYLVSLFGDVPYVTTTAYQQNTAVLREPAAEVYYKVIADLVEAEKLLSNDYVTAGRVRPNKWVAAALLSRAYLYIGEWAKAEQKASGIIDNSNVYDLEPLNNVFVKTSKEPIWQLFPEGSYTWSNDGWLFILTNIPQYVSLRPGLVNAFESGDQRSINWVGHITVNGTTYDYPFKYKENPNNTTGKEQSTIFRLGEQYLIRAEARAQQNNIGGAQDDLNEIRGRAGLGATPAATKAQLLDAVMQERRVELFSEWGHRWFDLKRTKRADAVMPATKVGWNSTDTLFPIPNPEILINPKLKQNEGYN